jgi:hypothetical protein
MMYWLLGGALFVLIFVGGLWWAAEHAPVREDYE